MTKPIKSAAALTLAVSILLTLTGCSGKPDAVPTPTAAVQETARRVYQILGCSGFARVDLFLTPEGRIVFHEVNTIPGFTPHSRFPSMMQAAGLSFREVLSRILDAALEEA